MKTLILLLPLTLLSGCSLLNNDISHFREEALQCKGHVILDIVQTNSDRNLSMRCEWNTPEQPAEDGYPSF